MQVLVGTHVVLANGGIMAPVGTHVVALAAKHHSCPFVVLTGLHKLSPLFPHDPSVTFNDFRVTPLDMQQHSSVVDRMSFMKAVCDVLVLLEINNLLLRCVAADLCAQWKGFEVESLHPCACMNKNQ